MFKAYRLVLELPVFYCKFIQAVHAELMFDEAAMSGGSILDYEPDLRNEFKMLLITFKSRLNEQLLAQGSDLSDQQSAVGKTFEALESWLWRWGWDLRGNYVRSGKIQLEDGGMYKTEFPFLSEIPRDIRVRQYPDPLENGIINRLLIYLVRDG
jgi:A1 cistron-splicing factor AAR2